MNVIKTADWIVALGPEGGNGGGGVIATGTPKEVAAHPDLHIGPFLKPALEQASPRRRMAG